VPYRGAAPAAVDVVAGRIDTLITNLADVLGQIEGGQLRLLAFTDGLGSAKYPDVPRVAATYPDFVIGGWFGICGPAGIPPDAAARWHAALQRAASDPEIRKTLESNGLVITVEDAKAFQDRIVNDRKVLGRIIREGNIKAE
jgi:tripartite-type tricarboxylate transporter receptor subunit TctC